MTLNLFICIYRLEEKRYLVSLEIRLNLRNERLKNFIPRAPANWMQLDCVPAEGKNNSSIVSTPTSQPCLSGLSLYLRAIHLNKLALQLPYLV